MRFDWTEQKVHSLSDQTQQGARGPGRGRARCTALYPAVDAAPVRELLDRYAYASPRFQVEFVDPSERPDLLEKFEIAPEQARRRGLVRVALGDGVGRRSRTSNEENLTNAMVKLTPHRPRRRSTSWRATTSGPIDGRGGRRARRATRARSEALANENYRVEPLLLAAKGEVPADADVVIVAGADAAAAARRARRARSATSRAAARCS